MFYRGLYLFLFSVLLFCPLNSYACDKVVYFIQDLSDANSQCPALCANSGGWANEWGCRDVGYCFCSCKGPCVYEDPTEKPSPRFTG